MSWTEVPVRRLVWRVALIVLTVLVVLAAAWLLWRLWSLLILAGMGLLVGTALLPYVEWVSRFTKRRDTAVGVVMTSLLIVVIGFGLLVLPPMVRQGRDLYQRAPDLQERAATFTDERGWVDASKSIRDFEPTDYATGDLAVRTGLGVAGFIVAFFSVVFLTLYFLLDASHIESFVYFSTPKAWHVHIRALLPALRAMVGAYIRGQAVTSFSIGVFTFILLSILRVPNALALAGIAMVADLVPLVGVFVLLAVCVLAALAVSPTAALIVLGAMLAYQQFEDRVLVPRIYGSALRLPTIAVVIALLAGAELLGILGALVALPVAAALRVVVEYAADARRGSLEAAAAELRAETPPDTAFAPDATPPARTP